MVSAMPAQYKTLEELEAGLQSRDQHKPTTDNHKTADIAQLLANGSRRPAVNHDPTRQKKPKGEEMGAYNKLLTMLTVQ